MASRKSRSGGGGDVTGLVVDLNQLASASLATVGGKALNLGRLAAADFPVPPRFLPDDGGLPEGRTPHVLHRVTFLKYIADASSSIAYCG